MCKADDQYYTLLACSSSTACSNGYYLFFKSAATYVPTVVTNLDVRLQHLLAAISCRP